MSYGASLVGKEVTVAKFGTDGKMVTGWNEINGDYYYLNSSDGKMLTRWLSDGTNKYYMDPESGKMARTWKEIDNAYYYFNNAGHMMTGWIQVGNKYYYLDPNTGRMVANTTLNINGTNYVFNVDGSCQNAAGVNAVVANPPGVSGNTSQTNSSSTTYGPGGSSTAPNTNSGSNAPSSSSGGLTPRLYRRSREYPERFIFWHSFKF